MSRSERSFTAAKDCYRCWLWTAADIAHSAEDRRAMHTYECKCGGTYESGSRPSNSARNAAFPEAKPERSAQHAAREAANLRRRMEGEGIEGTVMTTTEEHRWLPGEFLLELHFDQQVPGHPHIGVSFIGFDVKRGTHFAHG